MVKGILALALLGVLTAGDAVATSSPNLVTTSVSGALGGAVQVVPNVGVEQPAAASPAQMAPAALDGHATSVGSSTPQPLGLPAVTKPTARIPAPPAQHPPCPAGQHLGIACRLP